MLEEFRVSLFAQDLGTAYPVSEKRLSKRFNEIKSQLVKALYTLISLDDPHIY